MSNGRSWTADDDSTLRRMAGAGSTDREIADHMERDVKLIGRKRRGLRVDRGVPQDLAAAVARISARQTKRRKEPDRGQQ